MSSNQLLFEAGVYYRFPRQDEETPPISMKEFKYERFHNGKLYGVGRVFVMIHRLQANFDDLIDNWNWKGRNSGYYYRGLEG